MPRSQIPNAARQTVTGVPKVGGSTLAEALQIVRNTEEGIAMESKFSPDETSGSVGCVHVEVWCCLGASH